MTDVLLAHQGGWDEALLVLVPIAAFASLLVVATRRAKAIQRARHEAEGGPDATVADETTPSG